MSGEINDVFNESVGKGSINYSYGNIGLSKYASDEELAKVVLFSDYSDVLLKFGSACCIFFMLIGITGNFITITALATCQKVRNATAIFLINLHLSDLIFCCMILPMTTVTFSTKHWIFGRTMCRVYPFSKYVLNASSLFTAVAITINRCIMICHPHMYSKIYKTKMMAFMICTIWVSAFAIFLVSFFEKWGLFDIEPNGGLCTMVPDQYGRSPKKFFLLLAFIGPYLIMGICYARIWWVVRKTAKRCNKNSSMINLTAINVQRNPSKWASNSMLKNSDSVITDSISSSNTSATTPIENKPFVEYFKAPFRYTVKEKKFDAPTKRDKKLLTLIYAIMISFGLCHFPLLLTRTLYSEYKSNPTANVLAHLLEYSASCINPIIYVLMSSEYRKVYKSLYESVKERILRR